MLPHLLADENISRDIVRRLRARGYRVSYIAETSASLSDQEVLALARAELCWLLTHDRDYGELIFKKGHAAPPAVIYLRFISDNAEESVAQIVAGMGRKGSHAGFITVGRRGAIRVRPFPANIGG